MTHALKIPLIAAPEADGMLFRYRGGELALPAHVHDELELNVVRSGHATYLVGDARVDLTPRFVLWLLPRQSHFLVEEVDNLEMWVASFRPEMLARVCTTPATRGLLEAGGRSVQARRLNAPRARALDQLLSEVEARDDVASRNAGLAFAVLSAWEEFGKAPAVATQPVHPAVERAARSLSDPLGHASLDRIARHCGMSSSRLRQLFKQQLGVSMVEFRNRRRVERFLDLFSSRGDRNVTQAALDAGFGSYAQFHRVFKRVMGYGPADHRRRYS